MRRFLAEPGLIPRFAERSRVIAEDKFEVGKVNDVILGAMGL